MSRKQTACDEIGHINNGLNMTKSQKRKCNKFQQRKIKSTERYSKDDIDSAKTKI